METTGLVSKIESASKRLETARREIGKRVIGQKEMIDGMLMGILAQGHVLLEGVPGLAKTLAVKTLAEVLETEFKRIQFTPDLLPADLTGTMIYRQQTGEFIPRKGPVFSNIVLADEINRAPAKVQSALLEAMEEHQVTIGDTSYKLPDPFFVLATQNPIEQEGTYTLPEAQLDRFVMKLQIQYPSPEEELEILRLMGTMHNISVRKVLNASIIGELQRISGEIRIDPRIEEYIVGIVQESRNRDRHHHPHARFIDFGASVRATIYLLRCAKIKALFEGRTFVIPDDVKEVAYPVLRHRIVLSYEAESEELTSDDIISQILSIVPVP
jgi:MoxR-like ATPase